MMQWIALRDVGVSSRTMWCALMGVAKWDTPGCGHLFDVPHDAGDFALCHDLVQFCEVTKEELQKVTSAFPYFEPVIREWDILTENYEARNYRVLNHMLTLLLEEANSIRREVKKKNKTMTANQLKQILERVFPYGLSEDAIRRLFAPEYKTFDVHTSQFFTIEKQAMRFDFRKFGMAYSGGVISAWGVSFSFSHPRFDRISVKVFYDPRRRELYNSVLAVPRYTHEDYLVRGGAIRQTANMVKSERDMERYLKKLFTQFECPEK